MHTTMYATYVTQRATYEYDEIVQGEPSLAAQGCGKSDYVGTLSCRTVTS